MFLLLWKTIKLCKWLMPFHTAIFSLWISKVLFSLCLKQRQLCSKNLLDAFPVNPLSMFLYKQVFERTRRKADKQANSQWKPGMSWGARLVIITMPWICRPTGKHYLAHGVQERKTRMYCSYCKWLRLVYPNIPDLLQQFIYSSTVVFFGYKRILFQYIFN